MEGEAEDYGLYTDENGVNWIRTGDMGYLDEDGFMYFAGRKKRIIIISGYNIYPIDIEKYIDDHFDEVKECCLVKGYSAQGKILLRMFLSVKDGTDKAALEE